MKQIIAGILLIVCSCLSFGWKGAQPANDRILWTREYKLSWADFKGKPKADAPYKATTICEIKAEFPFNETTNKYEYYVKCFFIKSKSWVKKGPSDYLLNHEQLHFDMGEVYCRKMRKQYREKPFPNSTFAQEASKLYHKILKEYAKEQELYDKETNHSINKEKQAAWDIKVANQLKEFEKFK